MPDTSAVCPRCASAQVARGAFRGERGRAYAFRPVGLRFWTFRPTAVALLPRGLWEPNAMGCLGCGLVWSEVDAAKLRTIIERAGTEETLTRHADALAPGTESPLQKTEHG